MFQKIELGLPTLNCFLNKSRYCPIAGTFNEILMCDIGKSEESPDCPLSHLQDLATRNPECLGIYMDDEQKRADNGSLRHPLVTDTVSDLAP